MASIVLILLLLLVSIVSTQKCTCPLPALMQMASGVDITSFDIFPIGNRTSEDRGLLENIFNFTCSGVTIGQYLNKLDYDFSDYELPDQITDISVDSATTTSDNWVALLMPDWASVRAALLNRLEYSELTDSDEALGAFSRNPKYVSLVKQHFDSNKAFFEFETRSSELVPNIQVYVDSNSNKTRPRVNQSILSHDFLEYLG